MNGLPFNPATDLPRGLSEADVLEWIEADARSRSSAVAGSQLHRVNQAVDADARLGAMLEAMRVDRAALGSLESPAPPEWLAQAVLEEHERQALLALSDMAAMGPRAARREQDDESFSISAMPGWFKPAIAVAAVLAMAFGAWQLLPLVLSNPAPQPGPEIATNDPIDPKPAIVESERVAEENTVVAELPTPVSIPTPGVIEPTATEVLAGRLDVSVEEALELALAGRLMVIVSVEETLAAESAALDVATQPVDATWGLYKPTEELVAAMATPAHARLVGIEADDDGIHRAGGDGPLGHLQIVMASTPTVFQAQASASPEALLDMLDGLARLGTGIRLVPLDERLPGMGEMPAPAIESALLWWEGDPAAWQPWAAIPVQFVETR